MSKTYPVRFGKDGAYELTEQALQHILVGETVVRPVNALGERTPEMVLSGGLHTWDGWEALLKQHAGVVHLLEYDADRHDDWFYARELQNGVITLKIPKKMFTGSAANITMQPDVHYKSGYLWKTLYPLGYSEDEVIKVLTEAFDNLDREDSAPPTLEVQAGVLYGYAQLDEPLKAMKLRIQVRGNQIQSAFPAWEQPATGNNGKPFSHWHSVNFNIASSTVNHDRYTKVWGPVFQEGHLILEKLLNLTPAFILHRPRRDSASNIDSWRDMRERELISIASLMEPDELQHIETYLSDFVCCKDPYGIQTSLYLDFFDEIRSSQIIFNAAQLIENISECIQILTHSDLKHGTRRAVDAMVRFIKMAIVHTGGLCSLMFKRVLGEFVEAASGHPDENSLREFFAALAASPCRGALYTEFNLNPFVKQDNVIGWNLIGLEKVDIELTPEHLYEFIALNLGENYLYLFSKNDRLAISRGFFPQPELQVMVADVMSFLSGIDFQFFIPTRLEPALIAQKSLPDEESLIAVARDHSRMLVLYRQRIVMEDVDSYAADLDYRQAGSEEFFNIVRQKHKRLFVLMMHESMLTTLARFADSVGYVKLKIKLETMLKQLPKERIPLPKPIPDYILEGRNWPGTLAKDINIDALVQVIHRSD